MRSRGRRTESSVPGLRSEFKGKSGQLRKTLTQNKSEKGGLRAQRGCTVFAQHLSGSRLAPHTSTIKTQKAKRKRREENCKCWEAAICPLPEGWKARRTRLATIACFCCAAGPLVAQESSIFSIDLLPQSLLRTHTGSHTVSQKVSGKPLWIEFGRSLSWVSWGSWANVLVFCICREDNLFSSGAGDEDVEEGSV